MGKGKIAAQVAHAAVAVVLRSQRTADFDNWLREGQPKVVLKVSGVDELRSVCDAALAAGLPVEVVRDAGRTQVQPGTATCCAIGPAGGFDVDRVGARCRCYEPDPGTWSVLATGGSAVQLNLVLITGPMVGMGSWAPTADRLRASGANVQVPDVLSAAGAVPLWSA